MVTNKRTIKVMTNKRNFHFMFKENTRRISVTSLLRFHPATRTLLASKWRCSQDGPGTGTQAHSRCQQQRRALDRVRKGEGVSMPLKEVMLELATVKNLT